MPVPNTTTFSLQDVIDNIAGFQDDLVECFADADAAAFDPTYSGSKNNLLNFRNYNETVACNPTTSLNFYPFSGQGGSGGGTCPSGGSEFGYYFIGAGANVSNGDTVTQDSDGCSPFVGGNLFYRVRSNTDSSFLEIRVSDTGLVSSVNACT